MKKIILILILAIGFISESKAQENSEIYYYVGTDSKYSSFSVWLIQFQNYGKKIVEHFLLLAEGCDVDKKIQEVMGKHDWELYEYSSKYSNDKYDTYYKTTPGQPGIIFPISSGWTDYWSISKDKQTLIWWRDNDSKRNYYKRVTIPELKEMTAVKMPDFLE